MVKLGIVEINMEVESVKGLAMVTCAGRMIGIVSLVSMHILRFSFIFVNVVLIQKNCNADVFGTFGNAFILVELVLRRVGTWNFDQTYSSGTMINALVAQLMRID